MIKSQTRKKFRLLFLKDRFYFLSDVNYSTATQGRDYYVTIAVMLQNSPEMYIMSCTLFWGK
jgi:hypothetical protein